MNEIKKSEQPAPEKPVKTKKKTPLIKIQLSEKEWRVLAVLFSFFMLIISYWLIKKTIDVGANALMDSYLSAYDTAKNDVYDEYYQKYYDEAEKNYHVSNRGTISVGTIKDIGKLEVLEVTDVEFVIENDSDNAERITSWLEVPGKGTFVVNIEEAEFIIDNEQAHVLVRVPYPELTNVTIDYENVEKLLFKNNVFDDSYRVGEELARKQLGEEDALIKKEFASNEHYYLTAQKAGKSTIESLIRQYNPDESELVVEVKYY